MQWRQTKIDCTYFKGFCSSDAPVEPSRANIHAHILQNTWHKDPKNKVQHVPWMFSDTLSQAMGSTYNFIWISSAILSHSYHATFRSFFSLPQSQIPASIHGLPCKVITCALCLSRMQILCTCVTHYGSKIMVFPLLYSKIWNDSRKQQNVKAQNRRKG